MEDNSGQDVPTTPTVAPSQIIETQVKEVLNLKVEKILTDAEVKAELKHILVDCLRIIRQHTQALDIKNIEIIATPNGNARFHRGGFPKEEINSILNLLNILKFLVEKEAELPNSQKEIFKMIKSGYKAPWESGDKSEED